MRWLYKIKSKSILPFTTSAQWLNSMPQKEMIHILYFSFQVSIHIGHIRHRLSSFVNDKARATSIRELIDTLVSNDLDELDMTVLDSDCRQVLVDEVTELVAVLIQVQNYKVLSRGLGHFTHILVT